MDEKIIELANRYLDDVACDAQCGEDGCGDCPLNKPIKIVPYDYPFGLPQMTLCLCFDLINLNSND